MKITIIGTGYVGLPSGVGFAELGNDVYCVDNNAEKIATLNKGELTLYEDGLADMLKHNVEKQCLHFTTDLPAAIRRADVVILAVGTPPNPITKEADLQYIEAAATELALHLTGYTVIATKSTVPVGTGDKIEALIRQYNPQADFDVISLPEFLREGFAIHDFFEPERIVIGTDSERARQVMKQLYQPFTGRHILFVNRRSSETIKYASNAFLAVKLNYINEIANFCEKTGADIEEVATGIGLDSRIGHKFLKAGPGYGGSCFPKDTMAMSFMAKQYGLRLPLIDVAIEENEQRQIEMAQRIANLRPVPDAKIAILGLAFKNGTDDCRTSPAIKIVSALLQKGANIVAYDPKAMQTAKVLLADSIQYAASAEEALDACDIAVILTEWPEFKQIDWRKAAQRMRHKIIADYRNLLSPTDMQELGYEYHRIGRI